MNALIDYLTATVTVVSCSSGQQRGGLLVNSLALANNAPLSVSMALNAESRTLHLIREAGAWAVSFVDNVAAYADYGGESGWRMQKFPPGTYTTSTDRGFPIPLDALSWVECRLLGEVNLGRTFLLVGEVEQGRELRKGRPITAPVGTATFLL